MTSPTLKQIVNILKRRIVRSHRENFPCQPHGLPVFYWQSSHLGLGYLLAPSFGYVIGLYFLINMAYSKWLKHIPIIDVLVISAGFVLRVGAGVTLIHVERFSPWLYVVMTLLSLFLGFGKRRAELALARAGRRLTSQSVGWLYPAASRSIHHDRFRHDHCCLFALYILRAQRAGKSQHDAHHSICGLHHLSLSLSYRGQTRGRRTRRNIIVRPSVSSCDVPLGGDRTGHLLSFVNASAPGKIILFGEHAVVYNRPALAVPVTQVHADVEVLDSPRKGIWINAPGIDLHAELNSLPADHPIGSVILKLFHPSCIFPLPLLKRKGRAEGLEISITSTIPVAAGLGSGAAVSVALIRALALYLSSPLTDEQVNSLAYEIEKLHHGTPSGIDNTVITYEKPVYFIKDKPIEIFKVGKPFTIVIGDTGIHAPTKESVGDVRRLRMHDHVSIEDIFNEIAQIALIGRRSIESGKPEQLGELMDQNHKYLQVLTVSSPELGQTGGNRAHCWRTRRKIKRRRTGWQHDRIGRTVESRVGCECINIRRRKTYDHHRSKVRSHHVCIT